MSSIPMSPDFDQRIADWLDADPSVAPPAVLATVVAAAASIQLRRAWRVPRRFHTMTRFGLLGAAAVTMLAVVLGGLLLASGTPGPAISTPSPLAARSTAPSTAPSVAASIPPKLTQTFSSPVYGYTIAVGPGWSITPATLPADDPAAGDNGDDQIKPTGTD